MNSKKNDISSSLSKIYRNPLFLLIMVTSGVTLYLLYIQMKIGVPYWDVFVYLNNALYFAGTDIGSISYLCPFIPFLTSIIFRVGYVSQNAIFIIDSLIFIIGVIGLYLLLKQRFNSIQSFTGSLIFISFPLIMSWTAAGNIDIPAVSLSIWAIYFTVLGVKKDSKYLYLMLMLILVSTLTRYTAILLIFPILLYILIDKNYIQHLKRIGLVILVLLLISIPVLIFLVNADNLSPIFNLFILTAFGSSTMNADVAYNPDIMYYLENILSYISVGPFQGTYSTILNPSQGFPSIFSYIIAVITSIGLLAYCYKIINAIKIQKFGKLKSMTTAKIAILAILTAIFIITFSQVTYIISEAIFFGICYLFFILLKNRGIKNLDIDFLFISWFMTYFIFHSILPLKVDRYFITMIPALMYFILVGLIEFLDLFKSKIVNKKFSTQTVCLIIALLFLSSAMVTHIGHTPKKSFTMDIGEASNWLEGYDPNYRDKIIYSDYSPAASWYLKYKTNEISPKSFSNSKEFSNALQKNNADYYIDSISRPKPDIDNYQIIKSIDSVVIYKRVNKI